MTGSKAVCYDVVALYHGRVLTRHFFMQRGRKNHEKENFMLCGGCCPGTGDGRLRKSVRNFSFIISSIGGSINGSIIGSIFSVVCSVICRSVNSGIFCRLSGCIFRGVGVIFRWYVYRRV